MLASLYQGATLWTVAVPSVSSDSSPDRPLASLPTDQLRTLNAKVDRTLWLKLTGLQRPSGVQAEVG